MTTWTTIPDSQIASEAPITQTLMHALRDNLNAFAEGSAGAPQMNRTSITPGSSGADGAWVDATVVTGLGFFEPSSIAISSSLLLPGVCIARVNGDVTLSPGSVLSVNTLTAAQQAQALLMGLIKGIDGVTAASGTNVGGGGGSVGAGGLGGSIATAGGAGQPLAGTRWFWNRMRGIVGGLGGSRTGGATPANGGGCLILLVNGNVNATSAAIRAKGADGNGWNGASNSSGGGGGGSIIVVATGTITGLSLEAYGGVGNDGVHGPGGGGGGGGYVAMIASAYAGTQGFVVSGGSPCGGAYNGTDGLAGYSEQITLTQAQINSLFLRSY